MCTASEDEDWRIYIQNANAQSGTLELQIKLFVKLNVEYTVFLIEER